MIHPYIINDQIDFDTIKELWEILDCAYDDPDCHSPEARKVAEGGGSRLSGPTGVRGDEGGGSR